MDCLTKSELRALWPYLTAQERAEIEALIREEVLPFGDWLPIVTPTWRWDWHYLRYIREYLDKVTSGELDRLMLFLPPRHGKSEMVTIRYPVWRMERDPELRIIIGAYNQLLANKFSRKSKRVAEQRLKLNKSRSAVEDWETIQGGGLRAVGVGGGITGQGGQLIVIDDPVKNRKEAESETYQEAVFDWYTDDLYTRLEPGGAIILIMCLATGTRVATPLGWQNIESLQPGQEVWSYPVGGKKIAKRTIKALIKQPPAITYTIKTGNTSVRATGRHPFLVVRGGRQWLKKRADAFPVSDGGDRNAWHFEWVQAQDLHVGDVVATLKSVPGGYRRRIPGTQVFMDADYMWLLGYLWGDGWVTKVERRKQNGAISYCVCCAQGIYPERDERFLSIVERFYERKPYLTKHGYYRIDSNRFGRDMEALGLVPGLRAPEKRLPAWLWKARADGKRAFLQGLLDADGYKVKIGKQYRLSSASEGLVCDARELALTCGVRPTNLYHTHLAGVQPPHSQTPIDSEFYQAGLTFVHDKDELKTRFGYQPAGKAVRFAKITSVTKGTEPEDTWDLALDGPDENFVANGFIVHNTRWQENDLAGRILASDDGPNWTVVSLPAEAEKDDPLGRKPGEALCPERYDEEDLHRIKTVLGTYSYSALYQQSPGPREGSFFQRNWFGVVETMPGPPDMLVRYWDKAATDSDGDYTAGVLMGRIGEAWFVMDVVRGQWSTYEREETIRQAAETDRARWGKVMTWIEQEPGSSGKDSARSTISNLAGFVVRAETATGDKAIRAEPFAAQAEAGNVRLLRGSWNAVYLSELCGFPNGAHDDQVDASSGAFNKLAVRRIARSRQG